MGIPRLTSFIFNLLLLTIYLLLSTVPVFAQSPQPVDEPRGYADLDQLVRVFNNVISVVAVIGGFLAFIALIIGGFRYITARGDPKAIAEAQGRITYALIGLAFIIISWLIIQFISGFTGVEVTIFKLSF